MSDKFQELLDDYFRWLKDKTVLSEVRDNQEWVKITTPHLDRHNDCIQFYAKQEPNGYLLTDDGFTIEDLEASGCSLDSPKRQKFLNTTLAGFGITLEAGRLVAHATSGDFPLKKHSLVQAMLAVNDLFSLAQAQVTSLFYEDVVAWFDSTEIRYIPKVKFTGKSGYDHLFNFVIPKYRSAPERVIQAVTRPSKDAVQALMFGWLDTRDTRENKAKLYALLNDTESKIRPDVAEALRSYGVVPVLWSEREAVRKEFAA